MSWRTARLSFLTTRVSLVGMTEVTNDLANRDAEVRPAELLLRAIERIAHANLRVTDNLTGTRSTTAEQVQMLEAQQMNCE